MQGTELNRTRIVRRVLVLEAVATAAVTAGPPKYTVTEIAAPAGYAMVRPVGLNDAGQVALLCEWGSSGVAVGFLHTPGAPAQKISSAALPVTNPVYLSESGQVFGDTDPDGFAYGQPGRTLWRFTPGVGVQTLGIPEQIARYGWINAINNAGGACGGLEIAPGEQRGWAYSDALGWRLAGAVSPTLNVHGQFMAVNDAGALAGVFDPPATSFYVPAGEAPINIGHLGVPVTFVAPGGMSPTGRLVGLSTVAHPTLGMIGRAVRYTPGVGLLDLHSINEDYWTAAYAINSAGMVAGTVQDGFGPYIGAFRYDDTHGMVMFTPPPATFGLAVFGLSEAGEVLGTSYGDPYNEPWVWNPEDGVVLLRSYYDPAGTVDILGFPVDINNEGQVLLFVLDLKAGVSRALVLSPESCYPDCNADGSLTVADFGCFQTRFVAGDPYADCNGDGQKTVADFGCFQTRFVGGCP